MDDMISRAMAIAALEEFWQGISGRHKTLDGEMAVYADCKRIVKELPAIKAEIPSESKYEYHYDHTDCIWFRPEARNRCPSTCAQYRDGWNDAMQYIFRDGKGYRPFRRDEPYER